MYTGIIVYGAWAPHPTPENKRATPAEPICDADDLMESLRLREHEN